MTWRWYKVTVPIASFVIPLSRELLESYPFPPPATVYGLLLSYIGETNRRAYRGTQIAVGVTRLPEISWVLRKTRRFKHPDLAHKTNSKPDLTSVLTGLEFVAGVRDSQLSAVPSLNGAVLQTIREPSLTSRFGGLSCGESHNLVDTLDCADEETLRASGEGEIWWLLKAEEGEWTVSEWVDHVGSAKSVWVGASFLPETWERVAARLGGGGAFTIQPKEA